MRKKADRDAIFQSIRGAAEITGLSTKFIRNGCQSGNIPHIMVGNDYRINVPLFIAQLDSESRINAGGR